MYYLAYNQEHATTSGMPTWYQQDGPNWLFLGTDKNWWIGHEGDDPTIKLGGTFRCASGGVVGIRNFWLKPALGDKGFRHPYPNEPVLPHQIGEWRAYPNTRINGNWDSSFSVVPYTDDDARPKRKMQQREACSGETMFFVTFRASDPSESAIRRQELHSDMF